MQKWKIGLVVLGLLSAVGCGDSGSGDGDDTTSGSNDDGGATGSATTGGTTGGSTAGGTTGGTTGSDTTGGTTAGTTAGGADAGSTTGTPAVSACTNAADKAILDSLSVAQLACEGAACAAKNITLVPKIGIDEAKLPTCIAKEAPNLKKLSASCQQCFTNITLCVPKNCVKMLGGASDACSMGLTLPDSDFNKCSMPKAPTADCAACQKTNCEAAFVSCSGLTN